MTTIDDVEQWGVYELVLQGSADGNPFLDVELGASFTCDEHRVTVAGFYDGDGVYRVRHMPHTEGTWHYRTYSNREALSGHEGTFRCVAPSAGNHGPVRVANQTNFAYADGTSYMPIGTTCYVWNLQGDALEEQTLETLRTSPFNKIRFCVFPKRYLYNHNEPPSYPFPGEPRRDDQPDVFSFERKPAPDYWDFSRFNPAYFRHLEERVADLQRLGIEADLILFHPYDRGAWGFDQMPSEVNQRYLRYIVARLAAYRNIWWSFANEYELLTTHTMEDWDGYFKLVMETDPYNHLRSIHNIIEFYDHTKPWVTHLSVQHQDLGLMTTWLRRYGKPVVVDECGYEGDINQMWGDLTPQEMMHRFWVGFADGGYVGHGETYLNDEEVLWWSKGGTLRGESVARIAFLRRIVEQIPGSGLTPFSPQRFASLQTLDELMTLFQSAQDTQSILGDDRFNMVAGGFCGSDFYLFYYGTHQPSFRTFNLPTGSFAIDILNVWNMTSERVAQDATGQVRVTLPPGPYHAITIARNVSQG